MNKLIPSLSEIMRLSKKVPHLVIVDDTALLIVGEKFGSYVTLKKNPVIQKADRGDILEAFSHLDVVIDELIVLKIKPAPHEAENLIDLLDHIDSFVKIKILEEWKIIDGKLAGQIHSIKKVRNQYAHHWNKYFKYKGKDIYHQKKEGFILFAKDFQKVWDSMCKILMETQPEIIEKLKSETFNS